MIQKFVRSTLIMISLCSMGTLSAQKCTPDTTLKTPGFNPSSLPKAKPYEPYSQAISVLTIRDTMLGAFPATVDSVRITNVIGLPTGYSYECQLPNCLYYWDTVRCVRLYGTTIERGIFPLKIAIILYGKVFGGPISRKDTIRNFSLEVDWAGSVLGPNQTEAWSVFPNPVNTELTIYTRQNMPKKDWFITDASGKKLRIVLTGENGVYLANVSGLQAGMYLISDGIRSERFLKLHE